MSHILSVQTGTDAQIIFRLNVTIVNYCHCLHFSPLQESGIWIVSSSSNKGTRQKLVHLLGLVTSFVFFLINVENVCLKKHQFSFTEGQTVCVTA